MPWRRRRRPSSLRRRLMHTLLVRLGIGLTIPAIGTFVAVHTVLTDRLDSQLNDTARLVEQYAGQTPANEPFDFGVGSGAGAGTGSGSGSADDTSGDPALWRALGADGLLPLFIQVRTPDGRIAFSASSGTQPKLPAALDLGPAGSGIGGDRSVLSTVNSAGGVRSGPSYRVRVSVLPNGHGYLVLAGSEQDITDTMGDIGRIEMVAWLTAFASVGWLANRRIRFHMRPFERLGDQIVAIGAGELDRRVDPSDPATEVGRVGASVNSMLARLEEAFGEQRASEERLRRFIADASHELRTPLASIRGYAELFRRGAASRPEDLALAMRRIESESARMGTLVDELLLLARLDAGRPLDRQPVDLCALARDAVRDSQAADPRWPMDVHVKVSDEGGGAASDRHGTADVLDGSLDKQSPSDRQSLSDRHRATNESGHEGRDEISGSAGSSVGARDRLIEVQGDVDRLRQVLANLLSNVRAHTPAGTPASVSVRRDRGTAVIEVSDAGPGLTEDQQARVFERFYRADASRRRGRDGTAGGSGLGLSIVASVAAAHGGSASVRSMAGCGTVFTVRLPLNGGQPLAARPGAAVTSMSAAVPPLVSGLEPVAEAMAKAGVAVVATDVTGGQGTALSASTGPSQPSHSTGTDAPGYISPATPNGGPALGRGASRRSGGMQRLKSLVLRRHWLLYALWLVALVILGVS